MLANILIDIAKLLLEKLHQFVFPISVYKNHASKGFPLNISNFASLRSEKIIFQGSGNISLILWSWTFFFIDLQASTDGNFNQFYPYVNSASLWVKQAQQTVGFWKPIAT